MSYPASKVIKTDVLPLRVSNSYSVIWIYSDLRRYFIFGSIQFFSHSHSQWIFLRVSALDGGNMIEVSRKRPKEVYSCELMQRCYQLMQRRSGPQQYFTIFFIHVGLTSIREPKLSNIQLYIVLIIYRLSF